MAQIDSQQQRVVVRIVYDGPAFAGKTTTVRTLGRMFGAPVFASEDEAGRTLHFDWMEYQGGRFGDLAVCCQVITVPGQPALLKRRLKLLETADAVVFVADSRAEEVESGVSALETLRSFLQERPSPRPGLILQANKRDAPDAVDLHELRERLDVGPTLAVTESIALEGTGVRQTFVFAVRLALDRASELRAAGMLPEGTPEVDTGPALLETLMHLEGSAPGVAEPPRPTLFSGPAKRWERSSAGGQEVPQAPSTTVPSGRVWPPIEGRMMLHEATSRPLELARRSSGSWLAMAGPWLVHTAPSSLYRDEEQGRRALVDWARWHASLGRRLSPRRCIVLAEDGADAWRLWQVVRREVPLVGELDRALAGTEPDSIARGLLQTVRSLAEACDSVAVAGLQISLETVGLIGSVPAYVALVPQPAALSGLSPYQPPGIEELVRSLGPALQRAEGMVPDLTAAVRSKVVGLARVWGVEPIGRALAALLDEMGGATSDRPA